MFYSINRKEDILIKKDDMPFVFRKTNIPDAVFYNTFVFFGESTGAGKETQIKNCICRILAPDHCIDKATVIRDDDTVWTIFFRNFKEWHLINVTE